MVQRFQLGKLQVNMTNRWLYTLVALWLVSLVTFLVFAAVTPGVKPDPGHLISEVAPPTGCAADQVLKYDGSDWYCDKDETGILVGDGNASSICGDGRYLRGEVSVICRTAAEIVSDGGGITACSSCNSTFINVGEHISGGWYGICSEDSGHNCNPSYIPPHIRGILPPASCDAGHCACPSGYTLIRTGEALGYTLHSCYKN